MVAETRPELFKTKLCYLYLKEGRVHILESTFEIHRSTYPNVLLEQSYT